eukprot:1136649-Prorocentrum_minimum.AAC.1
MPNALGSNPPEPVFCGFRSSLRCLARMVVRPCANRAVVPVSDVIGSHAGGDHPVKHLAGVHWSVRFGEPAHHRRVGDDIRRRLPGKNGPGFSD